MFQAADFRYALRLWRRHPTLVLVAGLSLGLGVGATTTMYSVVNKVAHYELGFKDADRLAMLWTHRHRARDRRAAAELGDRAGRPASTDTRSRPSASSRAAARRSRSRAVEETSRVQQMPVDVQRPRDRRASQPLLGRTYRLEDFDDVVKQKEARAIVVSYDTWQRRLGGDERRHRDVDPRRRRAAHGDRRHAARLQARALGGRHRLLGGQRPAPDPAGALDDRRGPPEAGRHAGRGRRPRPPRSAGRSLEARGEKPGGVGAARGARCTRPTSAARATASRFLLGARQLRAADRVRERGQPAAGGGSRAAEGAGAARRDRAPAAAG